MVEAVDDGTVREDAAEGVLDTCRADGTIESNTGVEMESSGVSSELELDGVSDPEEVKEGEGSLDGRGSSSEKRLFTIVGTDERIREITGDQKVSVCK